MYNKILVPVDGSEASGRGLLEAIAMAKSQDAKSQGATLRLVHVVNELMLDTGFGPTTTMYYDQLLQSMREGGKEILRKAEATAREHGTQSQTALLESIGGRAADLIVEQARQWPADVIVMGTHGRRGLKRMVLGSDAEMVLRLSPVPVLMVRATVTDAETR